MSLLASGNRAGPLRDFRFFSMVCTVESSEEMKIRTKSIVWINIVTSLRRRLGQEESDEYSLDGQRLILSQFDVEGTDEDKSFCADACKLREELGC